MVQTVHLHVDTLIIPPPAIIFYKAPSARFEELAAALHLYLPYRLDAFYALWCHLLGAFK